MSEGYVGLVQQRVNKCTCGAFDPLEDITAGMHPRIDEILAKNRALVAQED